MNKKLILLLVLALLLLGGGYAWSRTIDNNKLPTPETVDDVPPEATPEGNKVNPDGTVVGGTDEPETPDPTPATHSPNPSSSTQNVVVTLSRVTVGDDLVTVTGFADTAKAGKCTLTLTQTGQKTLTYTSPAELEVSTVSCNPFRIPRSDFPTKGEWRAVITFRATGLAGTSNEWKFSL